MRISAIYAMSENRVIGKNNQLPWYLPADLIHFKKITLGNSILMGRKTYESIGRPLPGRENIIITSRIDYQAPGCIVVHSVEEALTMTKKNSEIFVIGGAVLFQKMLTFTHRLYITLIHQHIEGDVFFPEINKEEWQEVERIHHAADEKNHYPYSFIILDRIDSNGI